jgi:hypothetical protein
MSEIYKAKTKLCPRSSFYTKRDPIANNGPVGGGGSRRSTVEIRGELSQAMSYAEGEIASIAFESLRQGGEVRERKRDVSMPWKYGLSIPCRDNAHTGAFYRIPRPTNTWKTKTKPAVAPMASALRSQHTPYNPQGSPHTTGPRPASAPPLSLRFELALSSLPHRNGPYQAPGSGDTPVPLSTPLFKPRQFERMASAQPFPGLCPDCAFDCKSAHHLRVCLKKRQRLAMAGGIFSLDELYQERGIPRSPSPNLSPDAQLRPNTAAASGNSKARHAFPEPAAQPEPVTDANQVAVVNKRLRQWLMYWTGAREKWMQGGGGEWPGAARGGAPTGTGCGARKQGGRCLTTGQPATQGVLLSRDGILTPPQYTYRQFS